MPIGAVPFNYTPGDILVPAFTTEFNAGPPNYAGTSRQVILGRALPGSPAASGLPINVGSGNPNGIAGLGSIGAEQILYARQQNPLGEIYFLDTTTCLGAGAAASVGALTFAGKATANGTVTRYLAGERYDVNVAAGDTADLVAAAFVARFAQGYTRFNTRMLAPVSGAVKAGGSTSSTDVTLTARHAGTETNGWHIESGLDGDEVEVPGLTVTVSTPMAAGTGDVDMAAVLAKLGTQNADWLCGPYSTVDQLNAVRDFLSDAGSGRSAPLVGLLGHYTSHRHGNLSTQTAFGQTRNDRHVSLAGIHQWPHAAWTIGASLCGEIAFLKNLGRSLAVAVEIAKPMQTRVLYGLRPPKDPNALFGMADRDSLLRNGISTFTVTADGQMACDRIVTTYRVNATGLTDRTWLDIEDIAIAAYSARYFRTKISGTYPRCVLSEDNPANIPGVVTPTDLENTCIHAATDLHRAGVIRQLDLFTQNLRIFPDYANDRVNYYLPITAAAQLRINAINQTSFLDQSEAGI